MQNKIRDADIKARREAWEARRKQIRGEGEGLASLNLLLDNILQEGAVPDCKQKQFLGLLKDALLVFGEAAIPERNSKKLLETASKPSSQPAVLRMQLKGIPPSQYDLLKRLVKALFAISSGSSEAIRHIAHTFGPLVLLGYGSKKDENTTNEDMAPEAQFMLSLIQNYNFFLEDGRPSDFASQIGNHNIVAQGKRLPQTDLRFSKRQKDGIEIPLPIGFKDASPSASPLDSQSHSQWTPEPRSPALSSEQSILNGSQQLAKSFQKSSIERQSSDTVADQQKIDSKEQKLGQNSISETTHDRQPQPTKTTQITSLSENCTEGFDLSTNDWNSDLQIRGKSFLPTLTMGKKENSEYNGQMISVAHSLPGAMRMKPPQVKKVPSPVKRQIMDRKVLLVQRTPTSSAKKRSKASGRLDTNIVHETPAQNAWNKSEGLSYYSPFQDSQGCKDVNSQLLQENAYQIAGLLLRSSSGSKSKLDLHSSPHGCSRELTDGVESFSLLPASPGKRAQNHRLSISQNTLTPLPDSKLGFLPIPQGQSQESQTIEDFSENSPNSAQKDSVAEKSEGGMQTRDNPIANQQEPKSIETIESISKSTEENEIAKSSQAEETSPNILVRGWRWFRSKSANQKDSVETSKEDQSKEEKIIELTHTHENDPIRMKTNTEAQKDIFQQNDIVGSEKLGLDEVVLDSPKIKSVSGLKNSDFLVDESFKEKDLATYNDPEDLEQNFSEATQIKAISGPEISNLSAENFCTIVEDSSKNSEDQPQDKENCPPEILIEGNGAIEILPQILEEALVQTEVESCQEIAEKPSNALETQILEAVFSSMQDSAKNGSKTEQSVSSISASKIPAVKVSLRSLIKKLDIRRNTDSDSNYSGCSRRSSMDGEDLFLPFGLSMDDLLEIGEEVFSKHQGSNEENKVGDQSIAQDAVGMAQRIAGLVPTKEEAAIYALNNPQKENTQNEDKAKNDENVTKTVKSIPKKSPPPPPPLPPKKAPGKKDDKKPTVEIPETLKYSNSNSEEKMKKPKGPPPPPPPPLKIPKAPKAPPPPPLLGKKGPAPPPPPPLKGKKGPAPPPPPPSKKGKDGLKSSCASPMPSPNRSILGPVGNPRSPMGGPPPPPGFSKVAVTATQQARLKQIHWDNFKTAPKDSIWQLDKPKVNFDSEQIVKLFQVAENKATRELVKQKAHMITFIEQKRANNISIALSGIRMPYSQIKVAMEAMKLDNLEVTQLTGLLRATPEPQEREALTNYLKGEHPEHRGKMEVNDLSPVDRYLLEIMNIPRLQQRIECCIVLKTFGETYATAEEMLMTIKKACKQVMESKDLAMLLQAVLDLGNMLNSGTRRGGALGFKLGNLLRLGDMKSSDKTTSALKYVLSQLEAQQRVDLDQFMTRDLSCLKLASADGQMKWISDCLSELHKGVQTISAESNLAETSSPEGNEIVGFHRRLKDFHTEKTVQVSQLREQEGNLHKDLEHLASYMGEKFDKKDPCALLRTMQSVTELVAKSAAEIKEARQRDKFEEVKKKRAIEIHARGSSRKLSPRSTV